MDQRSLFAAFSLVAVFIYLYIGIYTYKQNRKSLIHRVFLTLCASYAIWSFAYAFVYISNDPYVLSFWNKVSAAGWCSVSAISLYLVILITENKLANKTITKIFIFSPAIVFFYMAVFLFGPGIETSPLISNIFYIGDFLYDFIFLSGSIVILTIWGLKTDQERIKRQSRILVLSSSIPFGLNLLTQFILPSFGIEILPLMGQLYAIIMIIGSYFVITRYKFMKIPENYIIEEVANEIMDMVILLNEKGEFIKVSKQTLNMLGYQLDELLKKNINFIFDEKNAETISIDRLKQREQNIEITIRKKNRKKVPVSISCIPIYDRVIHDFFGAVLVIQDISDIQKLKRENAELQNKAIRDSLTKLYNHQFCMQLIEEEEYKIKSKGSKKELTVMMLDIDHFKKVNDTYGHPFGDYVIKTVADVLLNVIRDAGYAGRFGGEEFIIILPQVGLYEAYFMGEKIRNQIETYNFENDLKLTISMGIKQHSGESSAELVKSVDDLLYKAKQNGRNRIEYSY